MIFTKSVILDDPMYNRRRMKPAMNTTAITMTSTNRMPTITPTIAGLQKKLHYDAQYNTWTVKPLKYVMGLKLS